MMLPQSGDTRITGLNRGPSALVNRRPLLPGTARPGMTPGAVPAPAPTPAYAPSDPTLAGNQAGPMPAPAPTPPVSAPMPPPAPTLKGVSVSGIDPSNDLRNSTIAPTNDVNRFDLINDRLKNYDATALPEFQAATRKITSNAAGQGRLGSGMYNTDLGNETLAAENARNSYFGNLLTDATQGTITDAANNRNELRGERGYQGGQEQQAYDRSRQGVFDTDTLTNSDFNRNLARTQAGFANDPSALIAQLAEMSGRNASAGAAGAGASSANQSYIDMLKKLLAGMGGGTPAASTPPDAMGQ